jgi:hypothetical protein
MATPNLISANVILGKTTGILLSNTNPLMVLNNPAASGKSLKLNTLNISNQSASAALITINFNTGEFLSGTNFSIAANISVPSASTLNIIDKTSQYYIEENDSIGAITSVANALVVTASYEEIS